MHSLQELEDAMNVHRRLRELDDLVSLNFEEVVPDLPAERARSHDSHNA
jgi:hypothetical protein